MKHDLEKAKAVLARHSRVCDAEAELGLKRHSLTDAFRRRDLSASSFLAKGTIPEGMRVKAITAGARGMTTHYDRESDDPPKFQPVPEGHHIKGMSTLVGPQGEVRGQWIKTDQEKARQEETFWAACERHVEAYRGLAVPRTPPGTSWDNLMTVYPLGDPHIGMLSWGRETGQDFDLKIAERDLIAVVDQLVDRAPMSTRGVLANVGDFFHAENDSQLTPKGGNKLDCDDRWTKITEVGFSIMRRLVDRMLQKHEQVEVVNAPGNHDPQMARMISLWLKAVYEKEPRVHVLDNANPFIYLTHGKNLIGVYHGDGCKKDALPGIMAADQPEAWGNTRYRFWMTGHIHHETRKEFPGVNWVESFRTLAPEDYWSHWKGFRHSQSLCAITFDAEWGEDVRVTVPLDRVRRAA